MQTHTTLTAITAFLLSIFLSACGTSCSGTKKSNITSGGNGFVQNINDDGVHPYCPPTDGRNYADHQRLPDYRQSGNNYNVTGQGRRTVAPFNIPGNRVSDAKLLGVDATDHIIRRNKKTGEVVDTVVGERTLTPADAHAEMTANGAGAFPSYLRPDPKTGWWGLPADRRSPTTRRHYP